MAQESLKNHEERGGDLKITIRFRIGKGERNEAERIKRLTKSGIAAYCLNTSAERGRKGKGGGATRFIRSNLLLRQAGKNESKSAVLRAETAGGNGNLSLFVDYRTSKKKRWLILVAREKKKKSRCCAC